MAGLSTGGRIGAITGLEGLTGGVTGAAQGENPVTAALLGGALGGLGAAAGAVGGGVKAMLTARKARLERNIGTPLQQANTNWGLESLSPKMLKKAGVPAGHEPARTAIQLGVDPKAPLPDAIQQMTQVIDKLVDERGIVAKIGRRWKGC
jgi:hypothetical protein